MYNSAVLRLANMNRTIVEIITSRKINYFDHIIVMKDASFYKRNMDRKRNQREEALLDEKCLSDSEPVPVYRQWNNELVLPKTK